MVMYSKELDKLDIIALMNYPCLSTASILINDTPSCSLFVVSERGIQMSVSGVFLIYATHLF